MADAGAIKQEPDLPEVPYIKVEPNEPTLFKITNVFSITPISPIPHTKTPEDLSTTGRETNVQIQAENPGQNNFPPPARISKKKSKRAKKQDILTCDICSTVFFNVESLEEHAVEMHVVDKEYKCTECTKSFISQEELESHKPEHEKEKEAQEGYKCPICSRTFTHKSSVSIHVLTHKTVKPYPCKFCPKSFTRAVDLECHEMNRHGKEKPFKCPECNKSFCRDNSLQDHIRTHSNEKTIVCENCGTSFKTKHSLKAHRFYCQGRKSGNNLYKTYKCSFCSKVYSSVFYLNQHLPAHTVERTFKCNLCSSAYKREKTLIRHVKMKHPTSA